MVTILLIIAGILLELIVLVGGVYLALKLFRKPPSTDKIEVKVSGKNITSDVIRDGVKSALQEISYEQEQEKIHERKLRTPEHMYSTSPQDTPVRRSGGNLVPYGLSDSEKAALEMFYDN